MSLWYIAWSYMWNRKLTTFLTIFSVALAVALISALLTIRNETRARFEEEQQAYDIVVGPPGSPLQLVLNAVYFLDNPAQAKDYVATTGKPAPNRGDWVNVEYLRRQVEKTVKNPDGELLPPQDQESLQQFVKQYALHYLNRYVFHDPNYDPCR